MLSAALLFVAALLPSGGERMHVLFIGDRGHHQPVERLHDVYGPLLRLGFAIDWEDELEFVTPERLADYDCVMMYANQSQHATVPAEFFQGLREYVRRGGGFVALHCTSGCFMQSAEWLDFVGARFQSHGSEVFEQAVVAPEHPIMADWANFNAWDETYVQLHHPGDRIVLSQRGDEPWSWVRSEGQGRVFYTASGHDERVWREPAFLDLLVRALDWAAGDVAAAERRAFEAPQFEYAPSDWVPNYELHDPRPKAQLPSTPEAARRSLIVPAGFEASLFASEPMVVNPIAMTWDERGRLWVVETPDYPNTVRSERRGTDRISILEDQDGDGVADTKTVFAEGLNLPTSLLKVQGGVIVTQAPDLLRLTDLDGDDRSDQTEVLFTGFGTWDTHAGPSNLRFGPDNAIWGAVGYSSYQGPTADFGSGLWRWQPGSTEPQFVAQFTNNTWGLGFRADGELFGSTANGAPSFFVGVPKTYLSEAAPDAAGAAPVFDSARFHPALSLLHQGDFLGSYTAAAGHAFATGDGVPVGWSERSALVCGPTGHLVGRFDSYADGSGWRTRDAFNACVSIDDWFCPVQAEVGPDGALWIADFAQFLILHNLPGNPERGLPKVEYGAGNAHLNPLRDQEHGRIFRIARPPVAGKPSARLSLGNATTGQLVSALDHPNRFWRETARRLLLEGDRRDALPALFQSGSAEALRVLAGFEELTSDQGLAALQRAFGSLDPALQKAALDALPSTAPGANALAQSSLLESPVPDVARHALLAAARMPKSATLGVALASRALQPVGNDGWLHQAQQAAIVRHADSFLQAITPLLPPETDEAPRNLMNNPDLEQADPNRPDQPAGWSPRTYSGMAEHTWEPGQGRNQSRALVIRSKTGSDTSWFTEVTVEPNTRYRLSAWIRTTGLTHPDSTHGALLNIHPRHVVTAYVQDDSDWTAVALEFQTGSEETTVSINCLYGGWGQSTGEAVYDDLALVSLGSAADLRTLVGWAQRFAEPQDGTAPKPVEASVDLLSGGDPMAGRKVFFENEVVACSRCHAWNGQGGTLAPDLGAVGDRLKPSEILESILDPGAKLAAGWTLPATVMPALRPFLSDQEVRDLVAFLKTANK